MEGDRIVEKRSMHCPKLDDGRVDEGDPDLELEVRGSGTSHERVLRFSSWLYSLLRWAGIV
jgi:hypothetical protein